MVKQVFSLALIILIGVNSFSLPLQDTKLQKTISRDFKAPEGRSLEITNKYGDLIINTWDKDSIKVEIEITAYGKNDDAAEKLMNRIDFDFDQSLNYIEIETVFDRKSGFFQELWNDISDYSKGN